jgi:hypothetical protein
MRAFLFLVLVIAPTVRADGYGDYSLADALGYRMGTNVGGTLHSTDVNSDKSDNHHSDFQGVKDVVMAGGIPNWAYVASKDGGINVVQTRPAGMQMYQTFSDSGNMGEPRGVALSSDNSYLFVAASSSNSLAIVDVSQDPTVNPPTLAGVLKDPVALKKATGIAYDSSTDRVYIAGEDGLAIVNVADRSNPVLLGSLLNGPDNALWYSSTVVVKDTVAYVAGSAPGGDAKSGIGLKLIDVTDPTNPVLKSTFKEGSPCLDKASSVFEARPGGLAVQQYSSGIYVFMADYTSKSVLVINVDDSTAPTLASTWKQWDGDNTPVSVAPSCPNEDVSLYVGLNDPQGGGVAKGSLVRFDAAMLSGGGVTVSSAPLVATGHWVGEPSKALGEPLKLAQLVENGACTKTTLFVAAAYPEQLVSIDLRRTYSPAPTSSPTAAPTTSSPVLDVTADTASPVPFILIGIASLCCCALVAGGIMYYIGHSHGKEAASAPAGAATPAAGVAGMIPLQEEA